mmetsp:Transcript_29276/g.25890  ORF Transcript_29276/g.25890 Transcript_29276/m.25890 type:complete len:258 (-) Transcript_29276:72-845(-)
MGAGKSSKIKPIKELNLIQSKLKNDGDIDTIFKNHPHIISMKFTNSGLDFLHYIVFVHNNPLFKSCIRSSNLKGKILDSQLQNGNKLIHTAIDNHNQFVVELLLEISENEESKEKNSKGITAIDLAKLRDNPNILKLFGIKKSTNPNEILDKVDEEYKKMNTIETDVEKQLFPPLGTKKTKIPNQKSSKVGPMGMVKFNGLEEEKLELVDIRESKEQSGSPLDLDIFTQAKGYSRHQTPSVMDQPTGNLSGVLAQES